MKFVHVAVFSSALVVFAVLFAVNQAAPGFADPDAYYHIKMAMLMAKQGLILSFSWLPYTTLAMHFTDQHVALHIALIPFVTLLPPFVGTKIFIVLSALLVLIVCAWSFRVLGLRWWWLATALLALTTPWTFRIQLVKATPFAVMLLLLALVCIVQRRYLWLFFIGLLYVWVHGGFFLLVVMAATWFVGHFLFFAPKKWPALLIPLAIVSSGIAIGLVVNPYFPNNIYFYWDQLVQIGIVNYQETIGVGAEWYPYGLAQLLLGSALMMTGVIVGVVAVVVGRRSLTGLHIFSLLLMVGCIALTMKSRRYVEYAGPTMAFFVAVWWDHLSISWSKIHQWMARPFPLHFPLGLVTFFVVVALTPIILNDLALNRKDITGDDAPQKLALAMQWLDQHAEAGDKVLHSDWDDFPLLFYYSDTLAYMAGLDPTFMYRADKERYWLWEKITTGKFQGDIDSALATLAVRYVLVAKDHSSMFKVIAHSTRVQHVYGDDAADIFLVR